MPRAARLPESDESLKLRERAYASFTRRLLARELRPGQFVSQRELVELTGLTLAAIRELVPRLEADGLIKTVPQRGMQIAHVDLTLIRNAFQFRLALEKEAVAAFALEASAATLAAMRADHERIVTAAARGVTPELMAQAQAIDWGFHDAVIDALGNEIISTAYRVNSIKIRLIRQELVKLLPDLVAPTMGEHLAVIAAFERRDAAGAVEAITRHIGNSRKRAMGL